MLLFLSTTLEKKEKLMIEFYFSRSSTITRLRYGPLGPDLDALATTLPQQGYAVADVTPTLVSHYISGLHRPPSGRLPEGAQGLSHLLQLWRQHHRLRERSQHAPCTEADQWLLRYAQYLDQVCGVAASTRSH